MHIIYPQDYFNPKQPDELFLDEAAAFKISGLQISVWNQKPIKEGIYLYRGWMLSEKEYADLEKLMTENNSSLIVNKDQYFYAHYLPNWYEKLKDLTPETVVVTTENLVNDINGLDWEKFFVKDFVKSLTTSRGSIANSKEEVVQIVEELKNKRSIEGGICLRKVKDFVTESETRYFCLNKNILSPNESIPDIVKEVVSRIDLPFFSVDIIKDKEGKEWLVEIGDGQVSDLKHPWTPEKFANQIKAVI